MRIGSDFLQALNRDVSALETVDCTVFYTPFDFIIVPARSSLLPFADVRRFRIPFHALMIYHPAVYRAVAAVLAAPVRERGRLK
jgi:triacylglycerol lipase